MGVPYYFSHIIQRYRDVIVDKNNVPTIDNLYLDSNSIIYDEMRKLSTHSPSHSSSSSSYDDLLIDKIIDKINEYVRIIAPTSKVFVAFDGVAPVAKLAQQRNRRFKGWFEKNVIAAVTPVKENKENAGMPERLPDRAVIDMPAGMQAGMHTWNSAAFTPGTTFMKKLSSAVTNAFATPSSKQSKKSKKIKEKLCETEPVYYVSTSEVAGEGEHKIFEFIREHAEYHQNSITAVYGIDSDLIMLALNHSHISNYQIYLYRETPEFIKSIDSSLEPNKSYVIDIPKLCQHIIAIMYQNLPQSAKQAYDDTEHENVPTDISATPQAVSSTKHGSFFLHDYIFICFLVGNDFVPKTPSINIRNKGIDFLLQCYHQYVTESIRRAARGQADRQPLGQATAAYLGNDQKRTSEENIDVNFHLTQDGRIHWKNVRAFFEIIASYEHVRILHEHQQRNRTYHFKSHEDTIQAQFASIPMYKREVEKNINPSRIGWEHRYYQQLFDMSNDDIVATEDTAVEVKHKKIYEICIQYLQSLEWSMMYYTNGCVDWRWMYPHHYAPLMQDICRATPAFPIQLVNPQPRNPIDPLALLAYVTPKPSLCLLLPSELSTLLLERHPDWYRNDWKFRWAYCRYFWESHAVMANIDLDLIEQYVNKYRSGLETQHIA